MYKFEKLLTLLSQQKSEMGKLLSRLKAQEREIAAVKNENRTTAAALTIESAKAAKNAALEAKITRLENRERSLKMQLDAVELSKVGSLE